MRVKALPLVLAALFWVNTAAAQIVQPGTVTTPPGGSDGQVQCNSSGVFAGISATSGQVNVAQSSGCPLAKTISGDATLSSGGALTIGNAAITLAKIQNAAANSKLLGAGASGSGASYSEITLGSGLTMTGTTLSASGGGSGCTVSGTVGQLVYNDGSSGCSSSSTTITSGGSLTNPSASAASAPASYFTGTIFTGGSGTTTFPHLLIQPGTATASSTWSTSGTAFGINGHSGAIGNMVDFQLDGSSKFKVDSAGNVTGVAGLFSGAITVGSVQTLTWSSRGIFSSPAAGQIQFGAANAASPVAQTILTQGSRGGTDTNVAGAAMTIQSGLGTGNATGSTLTLSTPHAGSTGTTQQTANAQITISDNLVAINQIASDSGKTDATVCEDTTNHQLFAGSGTAGICLGTSSLRYKRDVTPLGFGLTAIEALRPIAYRYKPNIGQDARPLHYGFAAEQVMDVLPGLVGLDPRGRPNSVDWAGVVPILVKAVQEQQREIEHLKAQLHHRRK
jgi:hypothetical protein